MGFFLPYETKSYVGGGGSSAILFPVRTSQPASRQPSRKQLKQLGSELNPEQMCFSGCKSRLKLFSISDPGFTPYRKLGFADSLKIFFQYILSEENIINLKKYFRLNFKSVLKQILFRVIFRNSQFLGLLI